MIRKSSIILFFVTLLSLLIFFEFFLRFYGVEFRIFLSDVSRKSKIHSYHDRFVTETKHAGVNEQTFNIYFLGESTMWGVPYGSQMSIPNMVEYRLGKNLGGRPVRIINFASAAKDAAYVRYLFDFIVREKKIFHPSLIVIYSGHNEFLKFHPTEPDYQNSWLQWLTHHSEVARQLLTVICRSNGEILEIDQRKFMDQGIFPFDRNGYQKVVNHYGQHLLHMTKLAEENEIPVIVSTLASNSATWEPNRSVFCNSALARKQKDRFIEIFQKGLAAERDQNYRVALEAYEQNLGICDSFSEVYFRKGVVNRNLQNYVQAREDFQKAIDYDGMPIRALSGQNHFILSLERFDYTYVVNSLAYLRKTFPDGLVDDRLIIDGIHPNLDGYLLISEAIAQKIHSIFSNGQNPNGLRSLNSKSAKEIFHLDQLKLFEVSYSTGRWISRLATWRYDPAQRLNVAESFFQEAVQLDPLKYEGYLGLGVLALMKADDSAAEQFLQKARDINVKSIDGYFQKPWTRKILRRSNLKASFALPLTHN